jgi:hypothetical protein
MSRSSPGSRTPPRSTRSWPATTATRTISSRSATTRKLSASTFRYRVAAAVAWRPPGLQRAGGHRQPQLLDAGGGLRPVPSGVAVDDNCPRS